MVGLARDAPTFGFFETLESHHNCEEIHGCEKAQERRLCWNAKPRPEGRVPRRGERLREDRPAAPGNTGPSWTNLPGAWIPYLGVTFRRDYRHEGQHAVKTVVATGREKPLEVQTPRTASAWNKAEKTQAESKRQEVEKTWRRSIVEAWKPRYKSLPALETSKGKEPQGRVVRQRVIPRRRAGVCWGQNRA